MVLRFLDESLGDIFVRLYGGIRAGCILYQMKYHVRCHTIWTISTLVFNLPANYRQVKDRIILSKYQQVMYIQEFLGKLPAN